MPKVSVVIPVYNVGGHLLACLDSVAAQSLRDIEVICVDDGSTDGSERLLDLYAASDSRFRVLHRQNAGVSAARNAGIEAASAAVVCFVDGDDLLEPMACEKVSKAFENDPELDIVKFSAEPFPEKLSTPWLEGTLTLEDRLFEGYSEKLVFEMNSRPFPWNGAYRTSFLRDGGICFPVGVTLGEDQVFSFKTLGRARRTRFLSDSLYRYRLSRKNSAMAAMAEHPKQRLKKHLVVIGAILDDWADQGRLDGEGGRAMLIFAASFVMLDILQIRKADIRAELLGEFRDIVLRHYSADDIARLLSEDRLRGPLLELCGSEEGPSSFGRLSIYPFVASLYGYKAAILRFVEAVRAVLLAPWHLLVGLFKKEIDDDAPTMQQAIADFESR